jgi:stress response protein YsnF
MSPAINHEMGDRILPDQTVPVHGEEISVSRRQVSGDTVQVNTITRAEERLVDEQLTHEQIEVERVPIGRPVDAAPPVREEGDTTIMSVVEEIVVVERRLILKEEVHIRRVRVGERHRETVMVRKQDPDPATMNPEDAQKAIVTSLATYAGGGADAPAAKERVINIMAAQMKCGGSGFWTAG